MPKKTGGGGHYNFIFFLNHVLRKTERTQGESTGRTPSIFLYIIVRPTRLHHQINLS
jgi:hypothetical protein